ncbi:protein sneaky [Bombyx mori]|uniref:Dendritic cell-specific transmembrane protein-like domain-containing protein n=1 Tax=Bombyx mori TaxID=7091 RepID=A0A8R2DKX4_BOMMO|nr:protein sneaky isoform X2 [Bombyx mori]
MTLLGFIKACSDKIFQYCPFLQKVIFSKPNEYKILKHILSFFSGFVVGQVYYVYLLKNCFFNETLGLAFALMLSTVIGICCATSCQVRCVLLLCVPMYCGKVGRGVLKAIILTYIVAGPITNMGLNAKEVVRVFGCSNELAYNLSTYKYTLLMNVIRKTALDMNIEVDRVKDSFRYFKVVARPIEKELVKTKELDIEEYDYLDYMYDLTSKPADGFVHENGKACFQSGHLLIKNYTDKLSQRCDKMIDRAIRMCNQTFTSVYRDCLKFLFINKSYYSFCRRLRPTEICDFGTFKKSTCFNQTQVNKGLGIGYETMKLIEYEFTKRIRRVKLQCEPRTGQDNVFIKDARKTNEDIGISFEEKTSIMRLVVTMMNVCLALLFLRIFLAAVTYHDLYLTNINHDNVYITGYFKMIDERRRISNKMHLLPLKKMERRKYIDIHSAALMTERSKLVTQVLKLALEMITATTFVMMDRMFYEALDMVRRYADLEPRQGLRDLEIKVDGVGPISAILRKFFESFDVSPISSFTVVTKECVPQPCAMPAQYFFKIYGGYLWILLLLYLSPYTLRLRRLICAYFYPCREKQRVLYLYNDILKKRMKIQKTLQRTAVQAVRTHYLSSENLLSMRMKFPELLGWLQVLPAARMTCLICGETEPRRELLGLASWYSCPRVRCPFIYCAECWREAGQRCLACDPTLAELSDVNSLSDDEKIK